MNAASRRALNTIRRCVKAGRYRLLVHFTERMDERGLFWPDVLAILDAPTDVRDGGPEQWGRPKWIIEGQSSGGGTLGLVCVLDADENGDVTAFVTIY